MSPDFINKIFFDLGQTLVHVNKVGPRLSEHIYPIVLDGYESTAKFLEEYPEYEDEYNNLVYINGLYSSFIYE